MNATKLTIFIILALLSAQPLLAQDYFEDLNGFGFPILTKNEKELNLFARVNIGDNSLKFSTFQFFENVKFDSSASPADSQPMKVGWGTYFKAKAENGIGSVFGAGKFTAGFSGGGYFYLGRTLDCNKYRKREKHWWHLVLSAGYSSSDYRYYEPQKEFEDQLSDIRFGSINLGLSFFYNKPTGKKRTSNLIWGGSVSYSKTNNYSSLNKVEIRDSTSVIDPETGTERTFIAFDEDGYVYARSDPDKYYKEFQKLKFRPNCTFIPRWLNNRIGIILYPSVDIMKRVSTQYDLPVNGEIEDTRAYLVGNMGLGLQLFDDEQRVYSLAGLFFEFNDLTNANHSEDPFFKRSIRIGITAALNLFTLAPK